MALDSRFASPTRFQAYQPESFLVTERWFARINDLFMLPRRVQEDEIALMNLTGFSPYMAWCFPESCVDYSRYLTFHRADRTELETWQRALDWYLRALTVRYGKPLLLKSPPHTARVRAILDVFPDAKFVHIRRNPYHVYVSTVQLLRDLDPVFRLRTRRGPIAEMDLLATYREMYDAFHDDVASIPAGQFTEIAFEDLERSPLDQLRAIYQKIALGEFAAIEPQVQAYLKSIQGYQKNRHPHLEPALKERIAERWSVEFDRWGYPR